ncbi:core [Bluegill hepatitis B virus]|nr:core [Bluegill hepatitis B virus]ANN02851.1 core [Bluegill hepatitis B virus]
MPPPDPFLEFGTDQKLINLLPTDFFPEIQKIVDILEAQYGDQIDSAVHHSAHHSALRQLLNCYKGIRDFMTWLLTGITDAQLRQQVTDRINESEGNRMQKAFWFHWASLTFGDKTVQDFIVSFATWLQTPPAYRPPNAPILSVMAGGPNYITRRTRGRSPTPSRRRSKSPRRSGSRGSRGK